MCADEQDNFEFEETIRSIAEELSRSVERAFEQADVEQFAQTFGVDPDRAREWADTAGSWLRVRAERLGDEMAARAAQPEPRTPEQEDPLRGVRPHPLDLPTEEQGLALAALDSGRWKVEPGTDTLSAAGDGPGPNDALGLVRELRARDWIAADGELTLAGRHALSRWLDAAGH